MPVSNQPSADCAARMAVVVRPISELKVDPRNPRDHSKQQVRQIARSIASFGFNVPVLIDGAGNVIAGHGRLLACELLGRTDVPTIRLDHLTPAQARAFMIADNRLTENSTWNEQLLAEQLRDLSLQELDFSIEATGFEMAEIDLKIESLSAPAAEDDPADILPEAGPAVSKVGDLWLLGSHRLFCGNALDESSYHVLMDGRQAAMVMSDPPFNVRIAGHVSGKGAIHHREFPMATGEMTKEEFTQFLRTVTQMLVCHSVDGSIHFLFIDWRHLHELLTAGYEAYTELKNLAVWVKHNGGMGSLYRSRHELVLIWKNGTAPHRNNVQLGQYGRYRDNVWNYPGSNAFGRSGEEGHLLALHPTVKPVALVADAMLDCSGRGDVILDPFLGSGTMFIAAERVGRVGFGMELDALYVDTAIRRWQTYTGLQARHALSGRTFDELLEQRRAAEEVAHG
jgi:hypothetical protein